MFNRYFHSNFTLSDYKQKKTEAAILISVFLFKVDEIVAVLKKLKVNKAGGPDTQTCPSGISHPVLESPSKLLTT